MLSDFEAADFGDMVGRVQLHFCPEFDRRPYYTDEYPMIIAQI